MASLGKTGTVQKYPPNKDTINQVLCLTGDGSGTSEMAINGAVTPQEFTYRPAIDPVYNVAIVALLERMNIYIETASRITPALYGDVDLSSGVGVKVTIKDASDAVIHNFTPIALTVTQHWGLVAGSDVTPSAFAAGVDAVNVRWTFSKGKRNGSGTPSPLVLDGRKGEYLSVLISDDLSGLTSQLMQVQGVRAVN